MDLMDAIRKNEERLKQLSFAFEPINEHKKNRICVTSLSDEEEVYVDAPDTDDIVDFCKTEMKKEYISEVVKLATVGSISCNEAASIIQNLQSSAYGLAMPDRYEKVVELHEPCSDDGKKLIACSCKMCGGKLDNNFTCMFCGTKYVWR